MISLAEKKVRPIFYGSAPVYSLNPLVIDTMWQTIGGTRDQDRIGNKIKPLMHMMKIQMTRVFQQDSNFTLRLMLILPTGGVAEAIGDATAQQPSAYFNALVTYDFLPTDSVPFRYKVLYDKIHTFNVNDQADRTIRHLTIKWRPKLKEVVYENDGNGDPIRWNPFLVAVTEYGSVNDHVAILVNSKLVFVDC